MSSRSSSFTCSCDSYEALVSRSCLLEPWFNGFSSNSELITIESNIDWALK